MVKVLVNGKKNILSINIDPEVMSEDKEMLEDLVLSAVNQALDNVDKASKEKRGPLASGLNIPGLF